MTTTMAPFDDDDELRRAAARIARQFADAGGLSAYRPAQRALKDLSDSISRMQSDAFSGVADQIRDASRAVATSQKLAQQMASSPALQAAMEAFSESAARVLEPHTKAWAALALPPTFFESVSKLMSIDVTSTTSIFEEFLDDIEEEADADDAVAPIRGSRLSQLTSEQLDALWRFVDGWGKNFAFDHTVLTKVFGDTYVLEVLQWAAVLAFVQVVLLYVLLGVVDKDSDPNDAPNDTDSQAT